MRALSKTKVGISVDCVVCGKQKKPRGRDAPVSSPYCTYGCTGYQKEPLPDHSGLVNRRPNSGYFVGECGVETQQESDK